MSRVFLNKKSKKRLARLIKSYYEKNEFMKVCELEPDGSPPWELLRKYGGKFRFFEKIKMGGVGSPKIVYQSGSPEIDTFIEETAGSDIPYVNFEYLRNGLLARVNKTQYLRGIFLNFEEIEWIELTSKIKELTKKDGSMITRKQQIDLGKTRLEIKIDSGEHLVFQVLVQSYDGLDRFFKKNKSLRGKFESKFIT